MANKQMTQEELLQLINETREKGFITGNLPSDPRELERVVHTMLKNMMYQEPSERQNGIMTGRQQLILKRKPAGEWNDTTDRRLPLFFEGREWSALFRDVLKASEGDPFIPGDDINDWTEKHRIKFEESIADYPMLGRIWDTYIDVSYQLEEVSRLRDECLKVKAKALNPVAMRGLDKLIHACDEALKYGLGLQLATD